MSRLMLMPLVVGTVTASAHAPAGAAPAVRAAPNNDPAFINVYTNNVENLGLPSDKKCKGRSAQLVSYMSRQTYLPDVFLVQQISGRTQATNYAAYLTAHLHEPYGFVIAEDSPKSQASPCGKRKAHQTNAVFYRTQRFTNAGLTHKTWQAGHLVGGACRNNAQARTKAVKVRLHDIAAGKDVTVASIHWPTAKLGGQACATANAKEATGELREDGYGGDLLVLGGDTNYSDRGSAGGFHPWYRAINTELGGKLGFKDPIYHYCAKHSTASCLQQNATLKKGTRIDFLFAQEGDGSRPRTADPHTIGFREAGPGRLDYSDHRAVRAQIYY